MNKNKITSYIINKEIVIAKRKEEYTKFKKNKERFIRDVLDNDISHLKQIANDLELAILNVRNKEFNYLQNNLSNTLKRVNRIITIKELNPKMEQDDGREK